MLTFYFSSAFCSEFPSKLGCKDCTATLPNSPTYCSQDNKGSTTCFLYQLLLTDRIEHCIRCLGHLYFLFNPDTKLFRLNSLDNICGLFSPFLKRNLINHPMLRFSQREYWSVNWSWVWGEIPALSWSNVKCAEELPARQFPCSLTHL